MDSSQNTEVTVLLNQLGHGDESVLADLIPLVYSELRRMASAFLQDESKNHTMLTTDLVHEAFLRMVGPSQHGWENRAHFFSVAAGSMRRILIDEARKRAAKKRGASPTRVSLDQGALLTDETAEELVALDEALTELATFDQRLSKIVELRFFAGLTIEEIAEALSISARTVKRDWRAAKSWLFHAMTTR